MENKFSRNYFGSTFCGGPRYQQHRNTSSMCVFSENSVDEMESLWKSPAEAPSSPESILFGLVNTKKAPEPEIRDSRITIIKAACVPLINSVCEFFRKNLPTLTPAPKQDYLPDFSNSSVYMGLVTATLPPRKMDHRRVAGDLVDLSNYTVIHRGEAFLPEKMEKLDDNLTYPPREAPATKATTKSDLNCPEKSPAGASLSCVGKSVERKMPTRRQREKKTCQNTQKSRKGKHMKEKKRKKYIWDIREDLNSEDDFEDEFEDVLSQEISSSIDDSATSQSPHTSDYVCDFIASIPSSEPRKISPCAFVKKLPAVLRMDIPFSPRKRQMAIKKSPSECDSDDSFIVFCSESPKGTPDSNTSICDRIPKFRACDRRRRLSEESDDSFVIFADDSKCQDDESGSSDCDETASETSESDTESEPIQLDSGFEERKVRFNLKPEVHVIRAWEFAYRQARKGDWDQVARDRDRFEKRILSLGRILSPILVQSHREKVFEERFRERGE